MKGKGTVREGGLEEQQLHDDSCVSGDVDPH